MALILGKQDFARSQGWSPSYVTELAQAGRLVMAGVKVDVEASLARIAATAAGTRPDRVQAHAEARKAKAGAAGPSGDDLEPPPVAPGADGGRLQVRKYRELVAREERLIDLGLFKGDLVQRDEANRIWSGMGVALRANLEAFIERIAPALCGCGTREAIGEAVAVAMRGERRKLKKLMVGAVRSGRRVE